MNRFRKPLLFSLAVLPAVVIAVIFTCLYQFDMYLQESLEEAAALIGSLERSMRYADLSGLSSCKEADGMVPAFFSLFCCIGAVQRGSYIIIG